MMQAACRSGEGENRWENADRGAEGRRDEERMPRACFADESSRSESLNFEAVVERYYRALFQFAMSLTHSEADACDLTQQTFYTWATKGQQLRDASKVKSWLFTTLYRACLQGKRRAARFPHQSLEEVDDELPSIPPGDLSRLDSMDVLGALSRIDEVFRAPLALSYLEDYPYKEIAKILDVPLGTVKSRIARGIRQLQMLLRSPESKGAKETADTNLSLARSRLALT